MLSAALVAGLALQSVSCGTIIHRDRVGQPSSGRLDTSIVVLDGLGLLLFFIPGIIAFVVDFSTGAVYLPEGYSHGASGGFRRGPLTRIDVEPARLDKRRIESIIRERTGRNVDLDRNDVTVQPLESVDEAPAAIEQAVRPPH
jgi:hypothetical protein